MTSKTIGALRAIAAAIGSTAPDGTVEMSRSAGGGAASHGRTCRSSCSAEPKASSCSAFLGVRAMMVSVRAPRCAADKTDERAVAPDPRMVTCRRRAALSCCTAHTRPPTSVLYSLRPRPSKISVFADAANLASGSTSPSVRATDLSGMVRLRPRQLPVHPVTKSASSPSVTSKRSYVQPVSPSSVYAARCSAGERECDIGDPRTAHRQPSLGAAVPSGVTAARMRLAPVLEFLLDLPELFFGGGEFRLAGVEVHRDEIQPLAVGRIGGCLEGSLPGRRDRARGQSFVPIRVVGRLARAVLGCCGVGLQVFGVDYGRVQTKRHLLGEAVVENSGHLVAIFVFVYLALDDAGHDDHVVGRALELLGRGFQPDLLRHDLVLIHHLPKSRRRGRLGGELVCFGKQETLRVVVCIPG